MDTKKPIHQHLSSDEFDQLERQLESMTEKIEGGLDIATLCPEEATIGKYVVQSVLKLGGQAYVFSAFDPDVERQVVIKLYRRGISVTDQQRVLDEARALARVNSPYVAECHSVEFCNGQPFMVMEYVSGETLDHYYRNHTVTIDEALEITRKLAMGIAEIHARGVLHLDLKPGNVMITRGGEVKIIDFGLTQGVHETRPHNSGGTPSFLPPERAKNRTHLIGPQTDVFGVGCILYFLLTGQPLYEASTKGEVLDKASESQIIPLDQLRTDVPSRLEEFCMGCLSTDPSQRPAGAREIVSQIDRYRQTRFRRNWMVIAAAVGLTGILIWTLWSISNKPVAQKVFNRIQKELNSDFEPTLYPQIQWESDWVDVVPTDSGVYEFPAGPRVRIRFLYDTDCFAAIYGFGSDQQSNDLVSCQLFFPYKVEEMFLAKEMQMHANEERCSIEFRQNSSGGTIEYLFFRASTEMWIPPDDLTAKGQMEALDKQRSEIRGLHPDEPVARISEFLLPYRVVDSNE